VSREAPPRVEEHTVGTLDEFPPGTHRVVSVGRREIGIFNVGGVFYALPNRCPHQGGPLCRAPSTTGTLEARVEEDGTRSFAWTREGEIVRCPWHGLEFHVPSGRCLAFPQIKLRSYDVRVDGSKVLLRM
jgi:nitrite reductase/ring-hydroxylating ferredoxin subunit